MAARTPQHSGRAGYSALRAESATVLRHRDLEATNSYSARTASPQPAGAASESFAPITDEALAAMPGLRV